MFLRFIWWQPSQFLVNRIVSMQTCLLIHYYQYFLLNQWHLVLFTFICHILVETAMIGKIESHRFFKHGLFLYWKTILNCCKRRLFRILDMNSRDMHFSWWKNPYLGFFLWIANALSWIIKMVNFGVILVDIKM